MTNEQAKAELAAIMDGVQEQMRTIARIQQQRAELTASATARGKKVTVTVNADNTVIDVKFSADIDELSYSEIAKAVVEATQRAVRQVSEKTTDLMSPLEIQRSRMPKLSDLVEGLADIEIPDPVAASTERPATAARRQVFDGSGPPPGRNEPDDTRRGRSVTDSSW
ncbi:YbaB/EbfC family nucleoid-associated protein [Nocardia rhamnosiphila]|uniref:YbaB/EbfC family nucleoid-associated protein n=1 Tax=Nocardia rhamnosiphila TaxID=426716 RepID=UPI0033FF25F7